jgi:hypothetical protein
MTDTDETYVVVAQIPAPGGMAPMLRFEVTAPSSEQARDHVRIQLGMCAQAALVDPEQGEMVFVTEVLPHA